MEDPRIPKILRKLTGRNMEAFFVKNKQEAIEKILSLIDKEKQIGFGGSMTLVEMKIVDILKEKGYNIIDTLTTRYSVPPKPIDVKLLDQLLTCDVLITGSNAVTEDGIIMNTDSMGTRVAPMIYGPDSVIVVMGKNKIVKNVEEARERIRNIAAPMNCKRKALRTPCVKVGHSCLCRSPDRICCTTTVFEFQKRKERMKVIIIDEDLGY
jgi:L-lactate utilization protein LutB